MIVTSLPLPPHPPVQKPAYDCPICEDAGVVSFFHDVRAMTDLSPLGLLYARFGGVTSSELCACQKRPE